MFFIIKIAFSFSATVIAAVVISFPLMYRSAKAAMEQVDHDLIDSGRTLGMSEKTHFSLQSFYLKLCQVLLVGVFYLLQEV